MTTHVVQYSGGIGSWVAAQRVIAAHGTADLVLLVADTGVEDPDLWRFVRDSTVHIGVPPTVVADGRTPFQVYRDQRFLVLSPHDTCRAPDISPRRPGSPHGPNYTSPGRRRQRASPINSIRPPTASRPTVAALGRTNRRRAS